MNINNSTADSTKKSTHKKLIITEKPSVARQFAEVLNVHGNNDGYIENEEWVITWCVGHLVALSYPEAYDVNLKKWTLEALPFLPEQYKYEVIPSSAKQFRIVKQLLSRKDVCCIYNAGDSGREGEYIQRLVFMLSGIEGKKPIYRIWIDSQTDEEIKRGIREAKPSQEYDKLSDAAFMRAIEDYAIGINLTRALSCKYGRYFQGKAQLPKPVPLAVGRVMTCVLGMVVNREHEIATFKPQDFYKINAIHEECGFVSHWKPGDNIPESKLYNNIGFKNKNDADELLKALETSDRLKVESVVKKNEKELAPSLYNLAELQNDCSRLFHISPDKTLEIVQSLYEGKLVTYPRTDARVLSSAIAGEIEKNLKGLAQKYPAASAILEKGVYRSIGTSKYTDDTKITDHYAIIPTGITNGSEKLSELSTGVYELIVRRFLAIFFPPAEYVKTEIVLIHPMGERFYASDKLLINEGYKKILGRKKDDKSSAGRKEVAQGDAIAATYEIQTSTTQPPKRYTSGSMILAMENAGNLIEEEELRLQIKGSGIGTSATRAEVIKKLVSNNYLALNSKTQILTPTDSGELLTEIVKDCAPSLLSPKMTASWEKGLSQIENGTISQGKYKETLEGYVRKTVALIKGKDVPYMPTDRSTVEVLGNCPKCGKEVVVGKYGAYCSGKCGLQLSKVMGRDLTRDQLRHVLSGKKILLKSLTSKSGKSYDAYMVPDGISEQTYQKDGIMKTVYYINYNIEFPKKGTRKT